MNFPPFNYYVKVRSCSLQESEQARKHPPASVDSERQDVVVEALLHHAEDLVLHGDLSALQALQTEQGDGRDRKRLAGRNEKQKVQRSEEDMRRRLLSHWGAASLTTGTALMDRAVKLGSQPILVRFG